MKIKNTLSLLSVIILTFSLLCGCQQETASSDIHSSADSSTTSDVSTPESSQDESSESESTPQTSFTTSQTSSTPETSSKPEPFKLTDNITQSDRNSDDAIATFEFYYGQEEWREITEDEIQLIYERVFGDKLIGDESVQNRVSYIGKTIGDLEIQLHQASYNIVGSDPHGVPIEMREEWYLSKKPPQLFSSMEKLYEIQKDVFSDITTYEDFLTKFEAFKFEDDGFYVKGRTPGLTSTLSGMSVLQYSAFSDTQCLYSSAVAVELDGEIKMAVIRHNCPGFTKDIYSVHIVPLAEVDGVLKFPRECDWEKAFGKSK